MNLRRSLWLLCLVPLALAGCGGNPLVPVKGELTLEGGPPLAEFTVLFMPTAGNKRPAYGKTDAEGKFELMTHQPGDGAAPGEYKVVVSIPTTGELLAGPLKPKNQPKSRAPVIHVNYMDPLKTPLLRVLPPPDGETVKVELKKNGT